ncbi:peptide ABC transporter substrate-binding protein [Candidatus Bipolaricaulota bacterium]|nr:peptide ABC transporter substrate-binding protein [Candidatus Bipolaricaulota bacterium]
MKFKVGILITVLALLISVAGLAGSKDFMIVGIGQEPDTWAPWAAMLASTVIEEVMAAPLFYQDDAWDLHPYMVVARPSIEAGTWQVFEEGEGPMVLNEWTGEEAEVRMIVDWEFREGILYHDGVPWSVEDVLFGRRIWLQEGFPAPTWLAEKVSLIEITGERTIRVYWNTLYPFADQFWGSAEAYPRHILEDTFLQWVETGDVAPFEAHPFWLTEFVGTGPFKLVDWIPGSHITVERFDDFFMGQVDPHYQPRLERLIFKFIEDVETLAIMVRTGEVHVTVPPNFPFDTALILYRDIEAGVVPADVVVEFREGAVWEHLDLRIQEVDLPHPYVREAFRDIRVRRALVHALDRQSLVDELFEGRQVVSHGPLPLLHPLMSPEAVAAQKVYEYDPELAKELLTEAGWIPGPDGIRVDADGNRFVINIRTTAGNLTREMVQVILADHWLAVGIETVIENLPPAVLFGPTHFRDPGEWPGMVMFAWNIGLTHLPKSLWHSVNIMPAGWNVAQWANPEADAIIEKIMVEMDPVGRQQLMVDFMRLWTYDVASIPLYFRAENSTRLANVIGFRPPGIGASTWNTWEWDWAEE